MSGDDPDRGGRRAFLRGGFFRGLVGAPAEETPAPAAPAPEVEAEPATMPWERPSRPRPGDGPRRPGRAGVFAIAADKCLAHRGQGCSTCRERCPLPGAIVLVEARPVIAADVCDGCGLCVATCPAPILAIRFVPSSGQRAGATGKGPS